MGRINFTFWITEQCNLRCRYCYVLKNPKTMCQQTIESSIQFVNNIMGINNEKDLKITFHGGEPLLNFEAIKFFTEHLLDKYKHRVVFELTTNGTITEERVYNYLINNNFRITVSIDGNRQSNDLNRIKCDGSSSYDDVMNTLNYFLKQKYSIRIRMTVNNLNVHLFSDCFIDLFEKKVGVIAFAIDTFNKNYNNEFWITFESEMYKIINFLKKHYFTWYKYYMDVFKNYYFSPKEICNGGIDSFHIDAKGNIYPCILAVQNKEFIIGYVETGINNTKLKELQAINKMNNPSCQKCGASKVCRGESCKIINKLDTDNYLQPCNYNCKTVAIYSRLVNKYGEDELFDKSSGYR